jgi:peptidoglycan/LPS O-acetylase OafA/YrhL
MSETTTAPGESRIAAIDELRGLAFLAVLASHFGLAYGLDSSFAYSLALPAFGVGVDLFFVIAGFFAAHNFQQLTVLAHGNLIIATVAFWVRRAIRIALPAWAVLICIHLVRHWCGDSSVNDTDLTTAATFVANFHWASCSGHGRSCPDQMVSGHFWSLALEMQFYLAAPLMLSLPRRVAIPIGGLILIFGVMAPRPIGGYLWSIRTEGFLLGLALGRRRPVLPAIGLLQAIYWLAVAAVFERIAQHGFSGASLTIVAIIFAFMLAGRLGCEPAFGCAAAALRRIGRSSYAAYLVHLPILAAIRDLTIASFGPALSMIAAASAICVVTIIAEFCIVRPAANLGRRASDLFIIINCTLSEVT